MLIIMFLFASFILFIVVCVAVKLYFRMTNGICVENTELNGKVIVITGGNTGIGSEYVLDMARRNCAHIVMACRNIEKGKQCARWVYKKIQAENMTTTVITVEHCDLSSFDSVVRFCDRLKRLSIKQRIDYLICFAAATGIPIEQKFTADGLEMHFQCNYLSHFLLIHLLLPLLNEGARIILTSSQAHLFGKIDLENINRLERYDRHPFRTYGDSKLALVILARELSKRLAANNILAYSFHPGTVLTNGIKHNRIWYLRILLTIVAYFYGKSHRDGAQTMIYLTVTEQRWLSNGRYYADCAVAHYNPMVDDEKLADQLWSHSYNLIEKYIDGISIAKF